MEKLTVEKALTTSALMHDIMLDVTWSKIAQRYFPDKSVPWFYNKLRGVDGNGGSGDFSYGERLQLRNALFDFAERIRHVAEKLD
jgi:hypothetical protein